ncbi:energy-coupling factor transporter ATPase [Selenomonas sp. TAMA-11512]|uniref:energy-coupling factor transporter ATPase n=1 Tax=Selenomonas sp. TAMA-11512 TaxID=3095337 RepID=UPI00308C8A88|nr:energy-coupling factor transporter ATPase [Selenomonas sp. TAMA-11512]
MSIELKQLSYTYMEGTPLARRALSAVSLTLADGEFAAIAGHTGSGKSTLVLHLAGLLPSPQGTLMVDGVDAVGRGAEAKTARQKVGLVFQYPETQLFEETVAADIAFGARNQGLDDAAVEVRVQRAMEFVSLPVSYRERSPFSLSGGEQRRVAIAGILAMQPKYLILDEPTAGLDPQSAEALLDNLKLLHESGTAILLVSHQMEDVARLASRVTVLREGEVVASGRPADVFEEEETIRSAGLYPPESVLLVQALRARGLSVELDDDVLRDESILAARIAEAHQRKGEADIC